MIRLLHVADVHLGAPLRSFGPHARERREGIAAAFRSLPALADRQEAQAVLVAGDLFDGPRPDAAVVGTAREAFRELLAAGRPVVAVPGNHDPLTPGGPWEDLPPGVHVFREPRFGDPVVLDLPGGQLRVHGLAFDPVRAPDPLRPLLRPPGPGLDVVLLHGHFVEFPQEESGNALAFDRAALDALRVDYVALGDHHRFRPPEEFERDGGLPACYPGSFAAVRWGENGARGSVLVDLESGRPAAVRHVPSGLPVVLAVGQVDVSDCADDAAVRERAMARIAETARTGAGDAAVLPSLTLTGAPPFPPDLPALERTLVGEFGAARVRDDVAYVESASLRQLASEGTVRGHLARLGLARAGSAEGGDRPIAEHALRLALRALGSAGSAAVAPGAAADTADAPRFLDAELWHGPHAPLRVEIPRDGPFVVAGPNGAGKTAFLEGLLRTVYGFNRRREADLADRMPPWSGAEWSGRVRLRVPGGEEIRVERSFSDDHVRVTRVGADDPTPLFEGEANPAGSGPGIEDYRARTATWLGLGDLDAWRRTAWIAQGELGETRLDEELLRVASGGHARVSEAMETIETGHEALTVERIHPEASGGRKHKPRALETARAELEAARDARERAARAARELAPLVARVRELENERGRLDRELAALEEALPLLHARRTAEAERRSAQTGLERLERTREELAEAARGRREAEEAWQAEVEDGELPVDFERRLGALGPLWARRAEAAETLAAAETTSTGAGRGPDAGVARRGRSGPAVLAVVAFAVAGILWSTDVARPWLPAVVAAAAVLLAVLSLAERRRAAAERRRALRDGEREWARRREDAARELGRAETALAAALDGLPEADTLTPETVPDRLVRFRRQRRCDERRSTAAAELAAECARARRVLEESPGAEPTGGPSGGNADADALLERLGQAVREARTQAAAAELRLERATARPPGLPDEVDADPDEVERARRKRRERREEIDADLLGDRTRIARAEAERGDLAGAEEEVTRLEAEVARLEADVAAHALAWSLLRDAHGEFRARDQERLVGCVSAQLEILGRGSLGPLEADADLAAARVRLGGRPVPLEAPPLSYGQRQVVLLAIRLGAADFLAAEGVRVPLVTDEPFAHLDPGSAGAVWEALRAAAGHRQVLVSCPDALLLEHLGIEPSLRLGG